MRLRSCGGGCVKWFPLLRDTTTAARWCRFSTKAPRCNKFKSGFFSTRWLLLRHFFGSKKCSRYVSRGQLPLTPLVATYIIGFNLLVVPHSSCARRRWLVQVALVFVSPPSSIVKLFTHAPYVHRETNTPPPRGETFRFQFPRAKNVSVTAWLPASVNYPPPFRLDFVSRQPCLALSWGCCLPSMSRRGQFSLSKNRRAKMQLWYNGLPPVGSGSCRRLFFLNFLCAGGGTGPELSS